MLGEWVKGKRVLIGLMAAGQALDVVTTVINIRLFGMDELNPLLRGLSLSQFAVGKMVLTGISALVLMKLPLPRWFYRAMVVGSVIPGAWNVLMVMLDVMVRYAWIAGVV